MADYNALIDRFKKSDLLFLSELYGSDKLVLDKQAKRYLELIAKFNSLYQHNNFELFSSPGRTEIGGNHTDHQHGRVLAGAVNMDNIAAATPNNTQTIRITSEGYPEIRVNLADLNIDKSKFFTSEGLVKGICARLKQLGYTIGGFDACIIGGVPEGSGLSSSASFEVLIGTILNHLFNNGKLDAVENAKIGQWAENNFFGKPCGLMDQTACSVGGFITIDFNDPTKPMVKALAFDFLSTGYSLVITDTGGSHANLNDEYASLPIEMKSVAKQLGKEVLRDVTLENVIEAIPALREKVGDRALLRALHFQGDNARVVKQVEALENDDFNLFLSHVIQSGYSSFMYNQNVYCNTNNREQGVALGLALSDLVLNGKGAWRVHGGGFAGTIQAFVPNYLIDTYISTLENAFGTGKCHKLFIRSKGSIKIEF